MAFVNIARGVAWSLLALLALSGCEPQEPTHPDDPTQASTDAKADVTGVSVSERGGAVTFLVTVKSSDTGCDQYADWWEVLSESGQLLYRRVLAHSHINEQPFTRSGGPVALAPDQRVIVRAHMNALGYGGRAMFGSADSGFEAAELPPGFAQEVAQQEPLPTSCAF